MFGAVARKCFPRILLNSCVQIQNNSISRFKTTRCFSTSMNPNPVPEKVNVTIVMPGTDEHVEIGGNVGDSLMKIVHESGLGMEGTCEETLACTTCHVYVDEKAESILPEPIEKEQDLLDTAPCLKLNSRLSCQIKLSKELDGCVFKLPPHTRHFAVDKKPKEK